jgi:hypothetical protein
MFKRAKSVSTSFFIFYLFHWQKAYVKNAHANDVLEWVHHVITSMLHTTELDLADKLVDSDIDTSIADAAGPIWSTYHTVLNASLGATYFSWEGLITNLAAAMIHIWVQTPK